jgi:site-specific DNA-methyltransferase (adenine-specific)
MTVEIWQGDCREILDLVAAPGSIQTCVTSPPYWGLRDYGVDGQIGLEPTPESYVANIVEVFRLVRDALADDGTLWINLGDCYAAARGGTTPPAETLAGGVNGHGDEDSKRGRKDGFNPSRNAKGIGLKHKDLIGIPWRVAFALQADGWYLRQDIIWSKPNPMPESVRDRCTKAHEYIFLLSKNQKYYFDAAAIAEPSVTGASGATRNKRSVWTVTPSSYKGAHFATFPPDLIEPCILAGSRPGDVVLDPFGGSGTTGMMAARLSRRAVLCELNPEYVALARDRVANDK